jgi:hypothetical protein
MTRTWSIDLHPALLFGFACKIGRTLGHLPDGTKLIANDYLAIEAHLGPLVIRLRCCWCPSCCAPKAAAGETQGQQQAASAPAAQPDLRLVWAGPLGVRQPRREELN